METNTYGKIDLCKILKDCPEGTELWCTIYGKVTLYSIDERLGSYPIMIKTESGEIKYLTRHGRFSSRYPNAECVLFPSYRNKDWTKFKSCKVKVNDPVMFSNNGISWEFGKYLGNGFVNTTSNINSQKAKYIVKFSEFNPNDLDSNKAKSVI